MHFMNYEIPDNDVASVASISNNDIIGKIFFDCEKNKLLKVVSVVNSNSIKVIECDYISEQVIREEFIFDYNKAKEYINQQLN